MKLRKYSEQELKKAVAGSFSLAQTLIKLGIAPCGGNYQILKKAIGYFQIDNSHFKGKVWNKGLLIGSKRPLENI